MFRTLYRWLLRRKVNSANVSAKSGQDIEVKQQSNDPTSGEWVAYDENLLESSRTQWQFGDWESLAALSRETLQHHPDRAKLALLAAAGHQQQGNMAAARQFTRLAQGWGASKKLISQVLIAGVHNTLGRAAALNGQQIRAIDHFKSAISTASTGGDERLLAHARTQEEYARLDLPSDSRILAKSNQLGVPASH